MNLKKLYNKYKDVIPYLFFGVCTTVINVVVYWLMAHPLGMGTTISTLVAWLVAVIFAYVTNRKWVFHSKAKSRKEILEEIGSFFACRIGTGIVDWVIMLLFVDLIGFNDVIIKFLANVIVIILNYIASKFIIFNTENLLKKIINYFKDKNKRKDFIFATCLCIFFFVLSFIFLINSPMHIWRGSVTGVDSSVFRTIALQMDEGLMPYRDTFDHKGPLLYIINYVGMKISFNNGIWFIELISLFVTLVFLYKSSRIICNRFHSIIVTLLVTILLFNYFEGGNLTEEYALPFICGSLYIFLDYLINKKVNNLRLLMCGLSLGSVLMLRPNMIALWIVFCLGIFIKSLVEKKYREILRFILYFTLGIFIVILPIFLWLYLNNSFSQFLYCFIEFNSKYSSNTSLTAIIKTLLFFVKNDLIIYSLILSAIFLVYEKKNIHFYNIIYMLSSLLLLSMSGRQYGHYGLIMIPAVLLSYSYLFNYLSYEKNKLVILIIYLIFMGDIIFPNWLTFAYNLPNSLNAKNNLEIEISNVISKHSNEDDKISVYGNWNAIYILSNRMPATYYSYQFPIGEIDSKILSSYYDDLKEKKPKIIVIQKNKIDNSILNFLEENKYSLIYGEFDKNNEIPLIYEL